MSAFFYTICEIKQAAVIKFLGSLDGHVTKDK